MQHTFKAIDEELAALQADVAAMGELAVSHLRGALAAFVSHGVVEATRIADADAEIDRMAMDIDRLAVRFIALRQPVADDLRAPIAAMKTASNLERCGDLARNIARRTPQLKAAPHPDLAQGVRQLGDLVAGRLAQVVTAYKTLDADAASAVWKKDIEVDALHDQVFHKIIGAMSLDPSSIDAAMHLLFVAKNLERIGDHATNIAELICYQATGAEMPNRPKGA